MRDGAGARARAAALVRERGGPPRASPPAALRCRRAARASRGAALGAGFTHGERAGRGVQTRPGCTTTWARCCSRCGRSTTRNATFASPRAASAAYTTAMNNLVVGSRSDDGRSAEAARWFPADCCARKNDTPSAARGRLCTALSERVIGALHCGARAARRGRRLGRGRAAGRWARPAGRCSKPRISPRAGGGRAARWRWNTALRRAAALLSCSSDGPGASAARPRPSSGNTRPCLPRASAGEREADALLREPERALRARQQRRATPDRRPHSLVVMLEALDGCTRDLGGLYTAIGGIDAAARGVDGRRRVAHARRRRGRVRRAERRAPSTLSCSTSYPHRQSGGEFRLRAWRLAAIAARSLTFTSRQNRRSICDHRRRPRGGGDARPRRCGAGRAWSRACSAAASASATRSRTPPRRSRAISWSSRTLMSVPRSARRAAPAARLERFRGWALPTPMEVHGFAPDFAGTGTASFSRTAKAAELGVWRPCCERPRPDRRARALRAIRPSSSTRRTRGVTANARRRVIKLNVIAPHRGRRRDGPRREQARLGWRGP